MGLCYKIPDKSLAFPYDRSTNLLLIELLEVDLSMWFDSIKLLATWPLIKDKFTKWMDKVQKAKDES